MLILKEFWKTDLGKLRMNYELNRTDWLLTVDENIKVRTEDTYFKSATNESP